MQIRTNANQVIRNLTQRLTNPQSIDNTIKRIATTMLAELGTRVFEEGKASDEGDIGLYSKKPIYVSIASNPARSFGRPLGKPNKNGKRRSTFATWHGFPVTGKDHKSRYFEGGYDQYKTTVGRNQLGKVNLSLSGQFSRQMTIIPTAKGYGIGWVNNEMFKRSGFFTKKYNKAIWKLTSDEGKLAQAIARKYYFEETN